MLNLPFTYIMLSSLSILLYFCKSWGNTITSIAPYKSSNSKNAIISFLLVVLIVLLTTIPPIITSFSSKLIYASSSSFNEFNFPLSIEVFLSKLFLYWDKGWPLTYIPKTSFSKLNLSLSSYSFNFGIVYISWNCSVSSLPPNASNNDIWPCTFFFLSIEILSNNCSYPAIKLALLWLMSSNAPHLIKLSNTLLLVSFESSLFTKSTKSTKVPLSSLSFIILLIILTPTFFTAANPNLILLPSTENLEKLLFMSGFKTSIPNALHSLIYSTTLSVLPIILVIKAAINSTG